MAIVIVFVQSLIAYPAEINAAAVTRDCVAFIYLLNFFAAVRARFNLQLSKTLVVAVCASVCWPMGLISAHQTDSLSTSTNTTGLSLLLAMKIPPTVRCLAPPGIWIALNLE